jgi:hypothetical protein
MIYDNLIGSPRFKIRGELSAALSCIPHQLIAGSRHCFFKVKQRYLMTASCVQLVGEVRERLASPLLSNRGRPKNILLIEDLIIRS